jgi:hypothetical protein
LVPQRTYYFRVVGRDRAGNVTIDDNGGQFYRFTTLAPVSAPWTDNLENGRENWSVISADYSEIAWTLGVPGNGASAYSPENAWGSNLDGGSASVADSFLISPAIRLSGGNLYTLRFQQNYNFMPQGEFDALQYGELLLLTNTSNSPIPLGTLPESSAGWEPAEIDLTPYHDQVVYVVWHYFLISLDTLPRFGWLVDDVAVTATTIVPGTIQITNNLFEARYVLTGPAYRSGQGASLVITNAPPGQYRIDFGDVPYFTTPPSQTKTLAELGTVVFQGNYTMSDSNHNGMADAWEQQYFGVVSPDRTRLTDSDGDGSTDYAEFLAGTNPTDPNSMLTLAAGVGQTNRAFQVQWPSARGHAYLVEGSTNGRVWFAVTPWTLGTGNPMTFVPTNTGPGAPYWFRLQVKP